MRFDDNDESSERDYEFMNDIDWNIIDDDVEELRSKAIREYWESLLDSSFNIIRVMEYLYILKDWYFMGYLMIQILIYQTNL